MAQDGPFPSDYNEARACEKASRKPFEPEGMPRKAGQDDRPRSLVHPVDELTAGAQPVAQFNDPYPSEAGETAFNPEKWMTATPARMSPADTGAVPLVDPVIELGGHAALKARTPAQVPRENAERGVDGTTR